MIGVLQVELMKITFTHNFFLVSQKWVATRTSLAKNHPTAI